MPVKRNRLGPREARCEEVQRCKRRGAAGFHVQVIARTPEVRLDGNAGVAQHSGCTCGAAGLRLP